MYASMPLSPRKARHFQPKAKRLIVFSRRYAPKNTIRLPPKSGTADTKEERNYSFYYLNTLLTISAAGFFAAHNNLFFIFHFFMYTCHRSRMTARVKRHTRPTGAVRIWQRTWLYFLARGQMTLKAEYMIK